MIGHVYISGAIGNSYEDDGITIKKKGFELIDLIEQIESLNESVEKTYIHVNSPGGYVSKGNSIAEFVSSLKNCFTIAEGMCASIATKIHLSVPLQNRSVQEGCDYIIHNPFLQQVTGDADELQKMADATKKIEEDLEGMYAKVTGLSKQALSGLMQLETALTPEQCVKFKFASSITKKEQQNVLALIYNEKTEEMKLSFKQRTANAMAAIKGEALPHPVKNNTSVKNDKREAKALLLETDQGNITTPFGDIMEGDEALWDDGTPAPDGTYIVSTTGVMQATGETLEAGFAIVVSGGIISSITPVEGDADDDTENTVKDLKTKLDAEIAKNTTLTETNATLTTEVETSKKEAEEVVSQMEELAKLGSDYTPPDAVAHFRKQARSKAPKEVSRASMKERKKQIKENKAV